MRRGPEEADLSNTRLITCIRGERSLLTEIKMAWSAWVAILMAKCVLDQPQSWGGLEDGGRLLASPSETRASAALSR